MSIYDTEKRTITRADVYVQVLSALMLRDMRTRFGGSMWGYVAQVLWPVAHVVIITSIMALRGIPNPLGDSTLIFVASGAVPVLASQYIAREMMKGTMMNRPLTYYPQVKMFDVIVSRAIVEIIGSFMGVCIVASFLVACGVDPIPAQIMPALSAYLLALFHGIALGMINVSIVAFFPGWQIGFILVQILLYLSSGIMFVPSYLPDQIYSLLKYLPLVNIVEASRLGYYPGFFVQPDYLYTFVIIIIMLNVGLLSERYVVRIFR